ARCGPHFCDRSGRNCGIGNPPGAGGTQRSVRAALPQRTRLGRDRRNTTERRSLRMIGRTPLPLVTYRAAARALVPVARLILHARARAGKEDRARLRERLGKPTLARPTGAMEWIHGASVGEG